MTPDGILVGVLLVEAGAFAAGICLLVGHVAYGRTRAAWLRSRVRAARNAVARTMSGNEQIPAFPWLPPEETMTVLAQATRSVDTAARDRLATLPAYSGLRTRASRWCTSRQWPRRLKGVRLFTMMGAGEDTVPRLLDDARPEVRSEAAAWMSHHPDSEGITRLMRMLSDDALSCRLAAREALIRLGGLALGPVSRHLGGTEPAALASLLLIAARLNDPSLRSPALAYRTHPDPAVRAAVIRVLTSLGGREAVETLEEFLQDPASTVRAAAATGLGELRHWPSAPSLAARLGDRAWEVRRASAFALSLLGGPGRLYLRRARSNTDPFAADMARQILDLSEPTAPGLWGR